MSKFNWKLLEPIKVGNMSLKNRLVMPPMENGLNHTDGSVSQILIDYYVERAKGGVGLIIVQNSYVDNKASRSTIRMLSISRDHMIFGLSKLAEAIKVNGAAALIQLGHGGRQATAECHSDKQDVAPSPIPSDAVGTIPRELTIPEIEEIQDAFANAAFRAKRAGFDGVEIHSAHGYLIGEFISLKTNLRTDKYGGSLTHRATFVLELIDKVRATVGSNFTVGFRMSGDEFVEKGLTAEDGIKYAKIVADTGKIDYIHVSGGTYESKHHLFPTMYHKRGHLLHLAEDIKRLVKNVPIITVGSLDVETGEEALKEGKADLVAIGRGLIADPELPNKLAAGTIEDIRPCTLCVQACLGGGWQSKRGMCAVNPAAGREAIFKLTLAAKKKKVIVIGGGITGMEAARTAAIRGHDVTLIERSDRLGGHLIEASAPKFKETVKDFLEWARKQVNNEDIKVQLNTEATPGFVKQVKPDVLIVSVGSDYTIPPVPGVDKSLVVMAKDVLLGKKELGEKVAVIGGGIVGCETALHIAEELDKEVAIVEMLDEILMEQTPIAKMALVERLQEARVEIHTGWILREITDQGILCEDKNWHVHEVTRDNVIIAIGLKSREEIVEKFKGLAPEVYAIGDCLEAREIYSAFEDAWRVVLQI